MLLELDAHGRHAAIKAFSLSLNAMEAVPSPARADCDAIEGLLAQLEPTSQETALYRRAADWIMREIRTEAVASSSALLTEADQ
jgi:hypothetical protein